MSVLDADEYGTYVPSIAYEKYLVRVLKGYLDLAGNLDLHAPYFALLSFVAIKGARLIGPEARGGEGMLTVQEDTLTVPEIIIEERKAQPEKALRPLFDMVWNAFGFSRSFNYDEQGNWSG